MELKHCQRCGTAIIKPSGILGMLGNGLCMSCTDALEAQTRAADAIASQARSAERERDGANRRADADSLLVPLTKEQKRALVLDPDADELLRLFESVDFRGKDAVSLDFKDVFADDCIQAGINPNHFVHHPRGDEEEDGAGWRLDLASGVITLERPGSEEEADAEEEGEDASETRKLLSAFVLALMAGGVAGVGTLAALHSPAAGLGAGAAVAIVAYLYLSR